MHFFNAGESANLCVASFAGADDAVQTVTENRKVTTIDRIASSFQVDWLFLFCSKSMDGAMLNLRVDIRWREGRR
jgi:hypothetical protein